MALTITADDINNYNTAIKEYSGYDRDNTVYDKQIISTYDDIKTTMKMEWIDVEDGQVELDDNFKYLLLSDIVYNFWNNRSNGVEKYKQYVKDLKDVKTEKYRIFVRYYKNQANANPFTITSNYQG